MIRRIRDPKALIASEQVREIIEKFESEINRGISTLCALSIIREAGNKGIHGYSILKQLSDKTNDILIIEEGTLYPLLRKLEKDQIVSSRRQEVDGRMRKNYFLTELGVKVYNRMSGFYSKLTEVIAPLFDVNVNLQQDRYLFCPMCANKIDLNETDIKFCDTCGYNLAGELKNRRLGK